MKKLIIKTALFTAPFFIMYLFYSNFYCKDKGDLTRLGYIPDYYNYDFRTLFGEEINSKINFSLFSEIDLETENKFTLLTIGDSFSEQGGMSYQNYIASPEISVLHYDRFLHENPIETVNGLLNGDVLNKLKVDYIILQSVERSFVSRGMEVNKKTVTTKDSLKKLIILHEEKEADKKEDTKDKFFNRDIILFPLNTIANSFNCKAYGSRTYQVDTKSDLFITHNKKLLFLDDDYSILPVNNDINNVKTLNNELNSLAKKLQERGIKLIVIPSPDKLDFYYDEIVNKEEFPRPLFFDHIRSLNKAYLFIDTKKILSEKAAEGIKDLYFYDDTHWSPVSTKFIGAFIKNEIQRNRTTQKPL